MIGQPRRSGSNVDLLENVREEAYKIVITTAATFVGLSILTVCVTVPSLYNVVHSMKNYADTDLKYCYVRKDDLISKDLFLVLYCTFSKESNK